MKYRRLAPFATLALITSTLPAFAGRPLRWTTRV